MPLVTLAAAGAWVEALVGRAPGWPELGVGLAVVAALVLAAARLASGGMLRALTRGPADVPRVALTFDDGPDPRTTPRVLEALAGAGVRATFFVVGEKARAHPDLVGRILDEGHELASHGLDHRWQSLLTPRRARACLDGAAAVIRSLGGAPPALFRPPYGVMTPALARAVAEAGVTVVGWTLRSWDTVSREAPAARAAAVAARAAPGCIILLHDAPERPAARIPLGPRMVEPLVTALRARGLSPVTVGELTGAGGPPIAPGESRAVSRR